MMNESVGMFWVVDGDLWIKTESLSSYKERMGATFHRRSTITYSGAHVREWAEWCDEYGLADHPESFMYYPRGRISYFIRSNIFELVIDPCLITDTKLVDRILSTCGIKRENTEVVTQSSDQSLHYICIKCRPDLFDAHGNCTM